MSNIVKTIDAKAASLIAATDDGRGREGSSLLAPEDLETQLTEVLQWMRGPKLLTTDAHGSVSVPRFGLISLILQQTPVYVYGHPALKKISQTAFTDGMHIFLSDTLMDNCNDNVDAHPSTFGMEWVVFHEIMHKLFNHQRRLIHYPPDIRNQATDLSINTRLDEGFPDIKPCPMLTEFALGFKPGDKERWMHLSEESIASELLAQRGLNKRRAVEPDKKQPDPGDNGDGGVKNPNNGSQGKGGKQPGQQGGGGKSPPSGQGKGGSPSQNSGPGGPKPQDAGEDPLADLDGNAGQPGGSQDGPGGPDSSEDGGTGASPDDGQEPSKDFGDGNDSHFISPRDFIKVLEENGLEAIKEKLELPDSDDLEALGAMEESGRLRQNEAIMRAQNDKMRYGGTYPGAHIVDAAGEMVKNFTKAKITWRLATQDVVMGYSPRSLPSMEEPHELLYVPGIEDVLGFHPYLASALPHKSNDACLFLIDTSGSMDNEAMRKAVTEALELKTAASNLGDAAATVYIWPCDTVLRGEPIEITDENVEDFFKNGMEMKGRGGTSIDTCINQALRHPLLSDKNIRSLVYCSDLYDNPVPKPETLYDRPELRVLFLADPKTPAGAVETFAKGTPWADVYVIEEGIEIDLEQVNNQQQAVSPSNRKKRKPAC